MAMPKSVIRINNKNGITFIDNVDRTKYTLREQPCVTLESMYAIDSERIIILLSNGRSAALVVRLNTGFDNAKIIFKSA